MTENNIHDNYIKSSSMNSGERNDPKALVLVVDDDIRIMTFLRPSLRLAGFDVVTTVDGSEVLSLVTSEKPDIMLLDILMYPVDGFEILRRLRPISSLPVIAISAYDSVAEEALNLGANDFLNKPFRPDELVNRIRVILNQ